MQNRVPASALPGRSRSFQDETARGLGYFSIALGLTELLAARAVTQALGLEVNANLGEGNPSCIRVEGGKRLRSCLNEGPPG